MRSSVSTAISMQSCTFAAGGEITEVPHIRKDVRDADARDLDGFDAVIHLAALSNDPLGNLNPDTTYSINHRASVRLARLAKAARVRRFLLASSCSNYGFAGETMVEETSTLEPGHALWHLQGPRRARHCQARRRTASAPFICARRPPTACRRASDSTSCSITWWPGRSPQA